MAGGAKRRWLVFAVAAGAGAWIAWSTLSGPKKLTGPVRVLPPDPAPAGRAANGRVDSWNEPAGSTAGAEMPEPAAPEPAAPEAVAQAESAALRDSTAAAEPVAPFEPTSAAAPAAPRPSPSPRPSPVRRIATPAAAPEPLPSGQALFAPSDSVATSGASPLPDGSAPGPEYTIKGNADSMLFHTDDSPYFARTKAEVWFRTTDEARSAGFTEWVPKRRANQ
jgi:hypothetical protein